MAPKKKKTVKRKPTIPMAPFEYNPPNVYELGVKPNLFVKCKICCTALPHLNFEWPAVPTDITLSAIKDAISKRHGGSLPQLTLYKGVVHPDHSLAKFSDAAALKDLGCEGVFMGGPDVPLPIITFFYDFKAACFDDSIAAVEPQTVVSKHDIPLKLYRKLTSPQATGTSGTSAAQQRQAVTPGAAGMAATVVRPPSALGRPSSAQGAAALAVRPSK
ncbi:hypothetical protein PLESTB_000161900 [Pleodorina starrii]|uniref:Uncharacterized protein n=1 Tax=Pleodorina starrii TaxID=330485 RepID=A0A9W6BBW6_9CHLO|nr:hypothetical protein PLESTM_000460200 [Pleodorina starrii]GLC48908.1 hypothetical protein PLESTB_000161900 [Pleodorina starrii]GLC72637.1 hypothetical protein PLESTF_001273300 [Pleodorina starrii]